MTDTAEAPSTAVATRPVREVRVVESPSAIMDTARFEHLGRVATVMAQAGLLPDSITRYKAKNEAGEDVMLWHDFETIRARAFLIASQADNWHADPHAVAQATSIVHGKLLHEGKLVHGIIEARLGVRLKYQFGTYDRQKRETIVGDLPPADDQSLGVLVSAQFDDEDEPRTISGSVAMWHTGAKGPWNKPDAWIRQLRYMGAREWARAHAPALLLGVVTDDEMTDYEAIADRRAERAVRTRGVKTDIKGKLSAPPAGGFSTDHVAAETAARAAEAEDQRPTEEPAAEDRAAETIIEGTATETPAEGAGAAQETEQGDGPGDTGETGEATDGASPGPVDAEDEEEELRRLAYEDGWNGEPVQAILSECDDDRERGIAAEEHARGVKERQEKDAAEAAAEKAGDDGFPGDPAADEFVFEAVGGPAPAGDEVYLLTTDEPAGGKLPTYKAGKPFSKVGTKGAAALKAYDGHHEPADPALASQSGGTGAPGRSPLFEEIAGSASWLIVKPRLSAIYAEDDFKALDSADQAKVRAGLWPAVLEMKDRTRDPVDWATDVSAFVLWLDHTAEKGGGKDAAEAIEGTFRVLQGSAGWEKLNDMQRTTIEARVSDRMTTLKGA